MIRLYGIRNKETGEQILDEELHLEDRENCLKFLDTVSDPGRYEMIFQDIEVTLKRKGRSMYMQTERGPVTVAVVERVEE